MRAWESTERTPADTPIVLVVGRRNGSGRVGLAATGVADTPVRLDALDLDGLEPPSDFRGSSDYRRHLAKVLTARGDDQARRWWCGLNVNVIVNGQAQVLKCEPHETLLTVLRREGYYSVRFGSDTGETGAAAVLVDGRLISARGHAGRPGGWARNRNRRGPCSTNEPSSNPGGLLSRLVRSSRAIRPRR